MAAMNELMKAGSAQFLGKYPRDVAEGELSSINAADASIFAQFIETRARGLKISGEIADIGLWRVDGAGAFDRDWLAEWPHIVPPEGLTWAEMERTGIADAISHIWITSASRHFDLECPDGVDNPFELPMVARQVAVHIEDNHPDLADRLREKEWFKVAAPEPARLAPAL